MRPANQDPMPKYGCVTAFRGRPAIGIKPRIARSIRILERYGLQERERERERKRERQILKGRERQTQGNRPSVDHPTGTTSCLLLRYGRNGREQQHEEHIKYTTIRHTKAIGAFSFFFSIVLFFFLFFYPCRLVLLPPLRTFNRDSGRLHSTQLGPSSFHLHLSSFLISHFRFFPFSFFLFSHSTGSFLVPPRLSITLALRPLSLLSSLSHTLTLPPSTTKTPLRKGKKISLTIHRIVSFSGCSWPVFLDSLLSLLSLPPLSCLLSANPPPVHVVFHPLPLVLLLVLLCAALFMRDRPVTELFCISRVSLSLFFLFSSILPPSLQIVVAGVLVWVFAPLSQSGPLTHPDAAFPCSSSLSLPLSFPSSPPSLSCLDPPGEVRSCPRIDHSNNHNHNSSSNRTNNLITTTT